MNKSDLIDALAPRLGGRAQAALAVESLVDLVLREVAGGGTVGITGFGTFEPVERAPRTGRNPRTGEAVPIAGTRTPRFRPGTYFKDVVADPAALPGDGLAGARVSSAAPSAEDEPDRRTGPGTPRSVRRTAPGGARRGVEQERAEPAPPRPAVTTGTPETVRAQPDRPRDQDQPAGPGIAPSGPRVMGGGEGITQGMISAKKAQLAKVKNDAVAAAARTEAEGSLSKKEKKARKGKKGSKGAAKKSGKGKKG